MDNLRMKDFKDTEIIFYVLISPLYWVQKFIDWMGSRVIAGYRWFQKKEKRIADV